MGLRAGIVRDSPRPGKPRAALACPFCAECRASVITITTLWRRYQEPHSSIPEHLSALFPPQHSV
ncbi:hypothetical protein C4K38_1851 [Pseudomonas chlororaphis subsp. piscium]|nr:hypothetical protein C4K38_1851 [Pseudomonas chlororaphis subsp. piscium]